MRRREFLVQATALTALGLPHVTPAKTGEPAKLEDIDTSLWEDVGRDLSPAERIAHFERTIRILEKQIIQMRTVVAKIKAGVL